MVKGLEAFEKVRGGYHLEQVDIYLTDENMQLLEKVVAADPDFDLNVFISYAITMRLSKEKSKN